MITSQIHNLPFGLVTTFTITNAVGASVVLSSLGAGIIEINVPDAQGKITNVAMTYGNLADYLADGPCCGKTPGRFANRIGHGKLTIDGKPYQLAVNCGPHHLHGGLEGFQNKIWDCGEIGDNAVRFSLFSPDGDENYPATFAPPSPTNSPTTALYIYYIKQQPTPTP